MEDLREIIRELQLIREEEGLKGLDDSTLFDCAVRIKNTKKMNPEQEKPKPSAEERKMQWAKEPATEKQKKFLEKAGYEGNVQKLSKLEANNLIDGAIKRKEARERGEYVEEN